MRIFAMLAASAHLLLAACQTGPGLLLPPPSAEAPSAPAASEQVAGKPTPYMRCVSDFWGNCTGVVSSRHAYRWRYVRPGKRAPEERESPVVRASLAGARESAPPPAKSPVAGEKRQTVTAPREPSPIREVAMTAPALAPALKPTPAATEKRQTPPASREPRRTREVAARDSGIVCHPRRRVIGEERPSQDDARRAAENGWMGAVRYDHGERYQDINKAKDVRHICGPSSVSAALRTPYFRCVVEGTPCRETQGTPSEPDERRYDRGGEAQISRR